MSGRMSERNSEFKIYLERVLIVFDCVACGTHKPSTDMRIMQSIFAKDIEDKKIFSSTLVHSKTWSEFGPNLRTFGKTWHNARGNQPWGWNKECQTRGLEKRVKRLQPHGIYPTHDLFVQLKKPWFIQPSIRGASPFFSKKVKVHVNFE